MKTPEAAITAFLKVKSTGPRSRTRGRSASERDDALRRVSGRNQLVGRIESVRISGLMAEVTLSFGNQQITSIITASSARDMQLKPGQTAAALIKATEVMIPVVGLRCFILLAPGVSTHRALACVAAILSASVVAQAFQLGSRPAAEWIPGLESLRSGSPR